MSELSDFCVISKEVVTVLAYFDNSIVEKIPKQFLIKLMNYAADSNIEVFIDSTKKLKDQNISEGSKDLLSLIYYDYIADDSKKAEIKQAWNINEEIYKKELEQKYNIDNLFKTTEVIKEKNEIINTTNNYTDDTSNSNINNNFNNIENSSNNMELIEIKNENFFSRFIKKLLGIIKK